MIRLLRTLVAGAFTLSLIVLVLLMMVASTPAGSAWLLRSVTELSGRQVQAEGVEGTLLDGMRVARLTVELPRLGIVAEDLDVTVFWPDLLRERLTLTRARAAGLDIRFTPDPEGPDTPVEPLLLPFALEARALAVDRFSLTVGDREPVVVTAATLAGELVQGVVRLETLAATLYGLNARARGRIGTGEPYSLDGELAWELPGAELAGQGPVNGSLAGLRFQQELALPDPATVTGTLQVLGGQPRLEAEARWQTLGRNLAGEGADPLVLRSQGGRLEFAGWTDGYAARFEGSLALGEHPGLDLEATARGDLEHLEITALEGRGLGGTVTGTGRLRFTTPLDGEFQLAGQGLDPAGLDPRFPGRVDLVAAGRFDAAGNFSVTLDQARGRLAGRPLDARGTVRRTDGVYFFEGLSVAAGDNRLEARGRWGRELAAEFRVSAPELGALWPGLEGALQGSGTLGGTLEQPRFTVDLQGEALAWDRFRASGLTATGGLGQGSRLDFRLVVTDLAAGATVLGRLSFRTEGILRDHALGLELTGGRVGVNLAGDGIWDGRRHTTTFTSGAVSLPGNQVWRLGDPAVLALSPAPSPGAVQLSAHCWALHGNGTDPARFCSGDLAATAASQSGSLSLRRFPMTVLADLGLVPEGLTVTGTADVDATGTRTGGALTGSLRWEQRDTVLSYRTEEGDELSTRFEDFLLSVDGTGEAVEYRAVVSESFGTLLTAVGRVTDPLGEDPGLEGRITGSIPDLARLGPLVEAVAEVGDLKGRVNVDVRLSGRLRQPAILGGIELEDGALAVPVAGITVDRIRLSAQGQPDGRALLKGSARSGRGHVELGGFLEWRDRLVPRAELTVRGRNLEVIRLPEGTVQVSPNVTVVLVEGQFRVGGEVLVPRAGIVLRQIGEGVAVPSPDTIVHGRAETAARNRRPLFVVDGLAVRLGPDVRFRGFGLDARLAGRAVLGQDDPADPFALTAQGSIQVAEGRFAILGEELTIDRGNLVFSGGIADPGIDARASRDVNWEGREVTVGVLLSGSLSRIQTRVFSEPAMGEMDALSYLTTGRPLSANTAGDRFSVSNAALSLGLQGALPVAQKLGSALNVDEIGLAGTGGEGTEVVIGERVGDDLYLRYSYGIFNKLGTVKATYRIGRRLSIEGSSGEEQALDLLYSIRW